MKRLIFAIILALCASTISAKSFLVDSNLAPTVSDEMLAQHNNDGGTYALYKGKFYRIGVTGFRSLKEFADNQTTCGIASGDTLYVAPGVYTDEITLTVDGITILGNNANRDWTSTRDALETELQATLYIKANNITINGFKVTGKGRIESSSATNASPLSGIKVLYNYFTGMDIGLSAHAPLVELGDMKTNATANTLSAQCRYKDCEVSHNHFEGDTEHLANCISIGGAFGTSTVTDNYFYDGGTSVYFANAQGSLNIKNNVFKNVGKTSYNTLTDKYKGEFCIAIYRSGYANSTTANIIANEFDGCYGQGSAFPLIRIFQGSSGSESEVQPVNFRINVNENTFKNKTSVTPPAANDQLGEKLLLFCDNSAAGNKIKFNISNNHFDNRFYKFTYVTLDDGLGAREIYANQFTRFYIENNHAANRSTFGVSSLVGNDVSTHASEISLKEITVLQSFDIDPLTGDMYFIQRMPTARNNAYNSLYGCPTNHDGLVITRVPCTKIDNYNYTYSSSIESMDIGYGGHGTNICLVRDKDGELWIWGGGNATPNDQNDRSATTARFKFEKDIDLNLNVSKDTEKIKIFNEPNAGNEYPAVDEASRYLCVRTTTSTTDYFHIYDLDDALEGKKTLIKRVTINIGDYARSSINNDNGYCKNWPLQSFDIKGDYLYIIEGTPEGTTGNIDEEKPTIVLTVYNWRSNTDLYRAVIDIPRINSLVYGEPQGIVIRPDKFGHANLYLAVVNGAEGNRKVNVYKYFIDYHPTYDENLGATHIGNDPDTDAHFKGDYPSGSMNYSCDTQSLTFSTEAIDGSDSKTITINNGEYIYGEWCGVITGEDGEAFSVAVDDNNAFSPTASATVTFKPNIYKGTKRTYNATLRLFSPLASTNSESNDIVIPLTATYNGPLAYGMAPRMATEQVTQTIDDETYYSFNLAYNAMLPEPYDNAYLAYTNGEAADVLPFRELIDKYVVVMEDATGNFKSTELIADKATHITVGNENAHEGDVWASALSSKNVYNTYSKNGYGSVKRDNFADQISITNGFEVVQANASESKAEGASHYSSYADVYSKPLVFHNVDPNKAYNFRLYLSKSSADKMDAWKALYLDYADGTSNAMYIPTTAVAYNNTTVKAVDEEYTANTEASDMPMGSHNSITNEGVSLTDPVHYRGVNEISADGNFGTLHVTSEVVNFWDIDYDIDLGGDITASYADNKMNDYKNSDGLLKGISTSLTNLPVKFATTEKPAEDSRTRNEPIEATQTYNTKLSVDYARSTNNSLPEISAKGVADKSVIEFSNAPTFTGLTLSSENIVAKLWKQNEPHLIYGSWNDGQDDFHNYNYDALMQLNWSDDIDLNHGIGVYASGLQCAGHNNVNVAPTAILSDSWINDYGKGASSVINGIGYNSYNGTYAEDNNWSEIAAQICSMPIKVHYVYGSDNPISSSEFATVNVTMTADYPILVKSTPTLSIEGEATATPALFSTDASTEWIDMVTIPSKTTIEIAGNEIITGVEDVFMNNKNLCIFPNPAYDFVNVSSTSNLQYIEIYSIDGQLMKCEYADTENAKINVSDLAPGTYILNAANQSTLLIKR
ncbi:MAG: T9SS type A sorting domain-containing protein [Muribaculaceae bacterium]|nr:T9SS type A sorting domain-containing protein [Muribaculaceae bacterium]